jgi:tetratricopeptide (TPR) repeat protein
LLIVLADAYTNQQRYAEAEACYSEIIQKSPGSAVAMNNLAVLWALQGKQTNEALKLVNKAIDLAGPLPSMLDSRASVYLALKLPEKALVDLAAALDDEVSPVRLYHRAQAYDLAGDKEEAAKMLQQAIDTGLKPESLQPLERPTYEQLHKLLQ